MKNIEMDNKLKILYTSTKKEPFFVDVPTMQYLVLDGKGHPNEEDFQIGCEATFTISYIIKFEIARKQMGLNYKVSPLEVVWDIDQTTGDKLFSWTMMIRQPDFVTEALFKEAIRIAKEKKKEIAYDRLDLRTIEGSRQIQAFHLGDYNNMNDTLAKMKAFGNSNGVKTKQYTHDIYLNDSRKTEIENLKTIMRIGIIS